jgi:excinuclease ABC subunit C
VQPRPDFPSTPGVYIWREGDTILYIGKAKNLRARLGSYYRPKGLSPKIKLMVWRAQTIEWFELASEEDALLLEAQLIKRHKPRFNARLKDDKRYPYVHVTSGKVPRVYVTRDVADRGGRYWGPYTDGRRLREAVQALDALYLAPLWGDHYHRRGQPPVTPKVWQQAIDRIIAILEGRHDWRAESRERMAQAAGELNFEYAARLRDWTQALEYLGSGGRNLNRDDSVDVIGWAQEAAQGNLQIFQLRSGELAGTRSYTCDVADLGVALVEAYEIEPPPSAIYMLDRPDDHERLSAALSRPIRKATGRRRDLAQTAQLNARNTLRFVMESERSGPNPATSVRDLERALALKGLVRIECYDISNLGTEHPVGAMAVMVRGVPVRRLYRRWAMEAAGQDDFQMIGELVSMRLAAIGGKEARLAPAPDLLVIDGGKGQLAAAVKAVRKSGHRIPVISLAKQEEQVFLPGHSQPLELPADGLASRLLQRLRDEVHRTAVSAHRERRSRAMLEGDALGSVKGLGPKRKERLIEHFGSVEAVFDAALAELEQVLGQQVARSVHRQLHR